MRGFWLPLIASVAAIVTADDGFQITSPAAGDTIAILDENYGKVELKIEWTVPEAIADRPVMLTLLQGDSVDDMFEVELIACELQTSLAFPYSGCVCRFIGSS